MATTIVQKRNIVVLGKTGAGKSTVANKIAGHDKFKVHSFTQSATSDVSDTEVTMTDHKTNTQFNFKIIDTIGLFDTKKPDVTVLEEIKEYFQDKVPEGVNLVLFIFRKGRFTAEEKKTFDYIIENFKPSISDISALIINYCENDDENGRRAIIDDFKTNAKEIAKFMGKGVYAVGFPDTKNMKTEVKEAHKDSMEADAKHLRELAMKSGEVRLGKEMFSPSYWEKIKQCVYL